MFTTHSLLESLSQHWEPGGLCRLGSWRSLSAFCRAEKSFTHRHLCEFTGLDFEMAIDQHYNEVLDMMDHLFVYMFDGLKHRCGAPFPTTANPASHQAHLLAQPLQGGLAWSCCPCYAASGSLAAVGPGAAHP